VTDSTSARRTGRRPGDSGTRDAIRDAASRRFSAEGFQNATVRAIAADAGVDPALVMHYFGNKQELFVAAMALPIDPGRLVAGLLADGIDGIGYRVVHHLLRVMDELGDANPILGMLRSAATHPSAARMLREFLGAAVLDRIAAAVSGELGVDRPRLRAELCASQIVGIFVARGIVELPTLCSTDRDTLAAAYGPTLQRYLTEPLG
jgi:AcrR family transcriptional regulator